ncbi:hypothetical protein [Chroococcidiopsis sp. SAG 2025]|uniref:hypothetical protein n=1 Tax=Chroococcidiopsis sp. SAG 2025 TaxID=171389 RepID=UPI00293708C2|nr:hypothetical protein [Chroococcidiopsis sp. SAG 2025]
MNSQPQQSIWSQNLPVQSGAGLANEFTTPAVNLESKPARTIVCQPSTHYQLPITNRKAIYF